MAKPSMQRKGVSFHDEVHFMRECRTTGTEKIVNEEDAWAGKEKYKRIRAGVDEFAPLKATKSANPIMITNESGNQEERDRPGSMESTTTTDSSPISEKSDPFDSQAVQVALHTARRVSPERSILKKASPANSRPSSPDQYQEPPLKEDRSNSYDSQASTDSRSSIKSAAARVLSFKPIKQLIKPNRAAEEERRLKEHRRQVAEAQRLDREARERVRRRQAEQAERESEIRNMQGLDRVRSTEEAIHQARSEAEKLQQELSSATEPEHEIEPEVEQNRPQRPTIDPAWSSYNDRQARLKALRMQREEAKRLEKAAAAKVAAEKAALKQKPRRIEPLKRLGLLPSPRNSFEMESRHRMMATA